MHYIYIKNSNTNKLREIVETRKLDGSTTVVMCENKDKEVLNIILESIQIADWLTISEIKGMSIDELINIMIQSREKEFNLRIEDTTVTDDIFNKLKKIYSLYFDVDISNYTSDDTETEIEETLIKHEETVIGLMTPELRSRIAKIQQEHPEIEIKYKAGDGYCAAYMETLGKYWLLEGSTLKDTPENDTAHATRGLNLRMEYINNSLVKDKKCVKDIHFNDLRNLHITVTLANTNSISKSWRTLHIKLKPSEDKKETKKLEVKKENTGDRILSLAKQNIPTEIIAQLLNISKSTVEYTIRNYGDEITVRKYKSQAQTQAASKANGTIFTDATICNLFKGGYEVKELARFTKKTENDIKKILKKYRIPCN